MGSGGSKKNLEPEYGNTVNVYFWLVIIDFFSLAFLMPFSEMTKLFFLLFQKNGQTTDLNNTHIFIKCPFIREKQLASYQFIALFYLFQLLIKIIQQHFN